MPAYLNAKRIRSERGKFAGLERMAAASLDGLPFEGGAS